MSLKRPKPYFTFEACRSYGSGAVWTDKTSETTLDLLKSAFKPLRRSCYGQTPPPGAGSAFVLRQQSSSRGRGTDDGAAGLQGAIIICELRPSVETHPVL